MKVKAIPIFRVFLKQGFKRGKDAFLGREHAATSSSGSLRSVIIFPVVWLHPPASAGMCAASPKSPRQMRMQAKQKEPDR